MLNKISFVVASVDRNEQLQQCISSIEAAHAFCKNIPIEILVVIQSATQKKKIQFRFPEIITLYYIEKLGLSVARNFAIEKSTGNYLVFLDDDARVKEDFIEKLSDNIGKYVSVGAFCGRLWDPDLQAPFSLLFNNNNIKRLRRLDYQYFMGSAHVLSRRVINKLGGYNERFGVGSLQYRGGEETEYFIRLMVANEEVLYLPDLIFFHPIIFPTYAYALNYGHAFGAMMTKNCLYDMSRFYLYCYIILNKTLKMSVRLLQKILFKGKYKELDKRYHYGAWLRGILNGIKDYLRDELFKRFMKKDIYD